MKITKLFSTIHSLDRSDEIPTTLFFTKRRYNYTSQTRKSTKAITRTEKKDISVSIESLTVIFLKG